MLAQWDLQAGFIEFHEFGFDPSSVDDKEVLEESIFVIELCPRNRSFQFASFNNKSIV